MEKTEEYLFTLNDLRIGMSDENLYSALQEMEVKYDVQQKELEIANQKVEIEQHKTRQFIFTGILIATGLLLAMLAYIVVQRTRRNRLLAETNAVKDKFFNIISHDLKNPAVAQRDTLRALVKNEQLWSADELTKYHKELLKSSEGGVELIFDLLSWSQLQTGRMTCVLKTFAFAELLPTLSLIRSAAENKNITFNVEIPQNECITCDAKIITTVIRNLLTNAVKFTASGGTVKLEIARGSTDAACHVSTGTGYIISITDTGIGISEKQLRNLFRLDSAHSQRGTAGEQGSGLGLIVCKELIEKHGSKLHIESEEGKGSRFWFEV